MKKLTDSQDELKSSIPTKFIALQDVRFAIFFKLVNFNRSLVCKRVSYQINVTALKILITYNKVCRLYLNVKYLWQ